MLRRKDAVEALSGGGGRGASLLLRRVSVPRACLTNETLRDAADAEGVVSCDVLLSGGKIASVSLAPSSSSTSSATPAAGAAAVSDDHAPVLQAKGAMLWPAFVDAHTHLCKTHAVPRCRNPSGSINDALACEVTDQPRWMSPEVGDDGRDVERRMDFALRSSLHHGTRAIRTHLDGTNSPDASLRDHIYSVYDKMRAKYAPLGLALQGVANLYLPLYRDVPEMAARHAAEAATHPGVVLGAYCGDVSHAPEGQTDEALDALFALAAQHSLDVDLHIDETNNEACCGVAVLCRALRRARAPPTAGGLGYVGVVVLGHVTSLALQRPEVQADVVKSLAALAPVTVVCNPFTNLGLQDRRGTQPPIGAAIDRRAPRTPKWRGLTLVQELRAAGVAVAAASDNVRDWWHPYGDYDCLAVWREAVAMGHLDTAPCEGDWADLITSAAAAAMGGDVGAGGAEGGGGGRGEGGGGSGMVAVGASADLVLFPGARRFSELLARPQTDRVVIRGGVAREDTELPEYSELDDLVDGLSVTVDTSQDILRGATKKS